MIIAAGSTTSIVEPGIGRVPTPRRATDTSGTPRTRRPPTADTPQQEESPPATDRGSTVMPAVCPASDADESQSRGSYPARTFNTRSSQRRTVMGRRVQRQRQRHTPPAHEPCRACAVMPESARGCGYCRRCPSDARALPAAIAARSRRSSPRHAVGPPRVPSGAVVARCLCPPSAIRECSSLTIMRRPRGGAVRGGLRGTPAVRPVPPVVMSPVSYRTFTPTGCIQLARRAQAFARSQRHGPPSAAAHHRFTRSMLVGRLDAAKPPRSVRPARFTRGDSSRCLRDREVVEPWSDM